MNIRSQSGRALTIFLVVMAVLLVSLTAISVFLWLKEAEMRRAAEDGLEQMKSVETQLQEELKKAKDQMNVYQQKAKESDDKVEGLMSELDLEKGVKDELKAKNEELSQQLDEALKSKEDLRAQMSKDLATAEEKIVDFQKRMADMEGKSKENEELRQKTQTEYDQLKTQFESSGGGAVPATTKALPVITPNTTPTNVELEKIVVANPADRKGKVINIDTDSNFIIVSLGKDDGIQEGNIISIYRGDKSLGNVKVTRVLKEMCAADFIPPLTIQQVQRDDRAVVKK